MDRVINFRGKSALGGHWTFGLLTKKKTRRNVEINYAIATADCSLANTIPVHEPTIGQFTGNYNCDDKEIYDGDILKNIDCDEQPLQIVFWNKDCWAVTDIDDFYDIVDDDCFGLAWALDNGDFKVIGNVHDNPELLRGGNDD